MTRRRGRETFAVMLKTAYAPHLDKHIVFGRRAPRVMMPKLKLSAFMRASLPPAPASTNYRGKADQVLREIYGNDQLGDCVPAGFAHVLGVVTGNAGALYNETLAQVKKDYGAIGGYVDGDPSTDNGCDEETAGAYYVQHGFANGTKALGMISVDPTNRHEVASAMFLFENLIFGVGLPDAWISPFPDKDGFVWNVDGPANPNNGHCFVGVDNDPRGIIVDSWALEGLATFEAIAEYCTAKAGGQLFVLLTPDMLAKGAAKAPNGVAWADLIAAFDSIGGHVPAPAPSPAPVPPAPNTPPTADQIQAAVAHAIEHAPGYGPFVLRQAAEHAAGAAIHAVLK